MKKAITILAVLIVLAGAVFAAETHTIRIQADVNDIDPIFALKYGATVTNTQDVYDTSNHSLVNSPVIANKVNGDPLKLDEGGAVEFYAVLQNAAKQISSYNLVFGGGSFSTVTTNGQSTPVNASIAVDSNSFADVDGCAVTAIQARTDAAKATFDGKKVTAAASGLNLVKATYTYTAAPNVDLLPAGQYYYADVTLTVTINN